MTATDSAHITGFCSCCDKPMWADRFADRGFRTQTETGSCSDCPTDTEPPAEPVARAGQRPAGAWAAQVQERRDRVIGHWESVRDTPGMTMKAAAAEAGVTYPAYWQTIQRAREAGDQRVPLLDRRDVNYQGQERSGPDWDQLLTRWHTELQPAGLDYRTAAEQLGVGWSTLETHLREARASGDERAVRRIGGRGTERKDTTVEQDTGAKAEWDAENFAGIAEDHRAEQGTAQVNGTQWESDGRGWMAPEDVERRDQLAQWHADDQAAEAVEQEVDAQ